MTPEERQNRRDLFAAAALIGVLANGDHEAATPKYLAGNVIAYADALMIALDEPTETQTRGENQ